jgi:hypothetical protein
LRLVVFLSYILYCFYIGVLLVFLPWSVLWEANGILSRSPTLAAVVLSGAARGAVSGLGVLLLFLGALDAVRFIRMGVGTES